MNTRCFSRTFGHLSECLFYLVFTEMTIMCNKCNSTEVEVVEATPIHATPLLAHWAGWRTESDTQFRHNRMREFMGTQFKAQYIEYWHNARKYRNGDHKNNQRYGHDTAKTVAKARPLATRDITTLLGMEPLAHYIYHIDNINRRVAHKIEPALFTAIANFTNGTWEAIEIMRDLHPHNPSTPSTTEQRIRYEASWTAFHKFNALHRVHVSTEDINQIAYYPTLKHMRDGREIRTRLGRYLTKYQAALSLSDLEVKSIAEKHASNMQSRGGWTVSFKEHDDEGGWLEVYGSQDVSSCMQSMDAVRVYAHEKSVLRLAYVQAGEKIIARCIVRDGDEQGWLRVYPDPNGYAEGRFLLDNLKANGYPERTNLDGVLLRYLTNGGSVVCPYLDSGDNGTQGVDVITRDDKTYLLAGGDEYNATNTNGYAEQEDETCSCDCCGDGGFHEDDLSYIDHDGNTVCDDCRERNYTYAYGRRYQEYYPEDECVRVGDEWYWAETLDYHDIYKCEHDGEYYHMDDMSETVDGWYHNDYVVCVGHPDTNGNDYVYQDKVHELSDGTTCHEDQADEYQAEIDADEREREMMVEAMQA